MGDKKYGTDGPRFEVVVQDEEIGGSVFEDGAFHLGVGGINDSASQRLRLAFQLERRFARWAKVVDGDGVARRDVKPWRFAGGTEEVCGAPRFSANTGALGGAFVAVEAGCREMKIHAGIRSRLIRINKGAVTAGPKSPAPELEILRFINSYL